MPDAAKLQLNSIDPNILNNLSEQEREILLKTLSNMSKGDDKLFQKLKYQDYDEIPVDIETFLTDKNYLGNGLIDNGKFTVFPYWVKTLKKLFPDNLTTAYNTLILTGGIGLGKSLVAVLALLYLLYRLLCLKDPYNFYGMQPIDKITISLINVTEEAAKGVAWDKMQQLLQMSPWFMSHGVVSGRTNIAWTPNKRIELVIGSNNNAIIGRALFANFTDEINFAAMTTDVDKIKSKQKHLISQVDARMQSRFMKGTKLPTLNIIASSKTSDQSFLDSYINTKKKNESKTTLIIDEAQWVIRNDKGTPDDPGAFYIAVGNKFLASEVLPKDASDFVIQSYRAKGYQMMKVPPGYYEAFIDNVELALTDIAGISTTSALKYISGVRLNEIKVNTYKNPFTRDIIEVGTGDDLQYSQFFDIQAVPPNCKQRPLYIHLDLSKSGDKTGIAGVWIMGKRPGQGNDKEAYYRVAFSVSVKAPKGYEISFEKSRTFIRWLKSQGFKIKGISTDTYQSAQIQQQLTADGFDVKTLSVDRLDNIAGTKTKVCLPYAFFKSAIYEKRLELYAKCDLLTDEIVGLEKEPDGHIEHPEGGTQGCFTGDTKVRLVDGRSLSFLELEKEFKEGKVNYVYSFNEETQRIEAKPIINAWCTGKNIPIMKVVLDNGEEIKCTLNHKFMNRDGSYTEAKNLKPLDSMMPLYTKINKNGLAGYRLYYEPMEDKWHYEHRQFATEVDDEKYLVHHKDCNPLNNSPDNLIWMSKRRHQNIHSIISTGCNSEEAREKRSQTMIQHYKDNKDSPVEIERSKKISLALKEYYRNQHSEEEIKEKEAEAIARRERWENGKLNAIAERQEKQRKISKIEEIFNVVWDDLSLNEKISYGKKLKFLEHPELKTVLAEATKKRHAAGLYENAYKALKVITDEAKGKPRPQERSEKIMLTRSKKKYSWKKSKSGLSEEGRASISKTHKGDKFYNNGVKNVRVPAGEEPPEGYIPGIIRKIKNHKIAYVEFLNELADVYDITVQDNHNFALDAGVFVHNSKDQSDAVTGALYNASQNIEQFTFEYGEDLDSILTMNQANPDTPIARQQISVAFEQELQNLLTPRSVLIAQQEEKKENANKYNNMPVVGDGMLIW